MKTNKILLSGIAACFAFMSTQAVAGGSIGGDCCADLEERVAELEATTVRKGNRKVSLKLSGQVNKAFLFADDIDTQIVDNSNTGSRFGLYGKAKISSDLYAGYAIELALASGETSTPIFSELRKNELYIGSKTFGKVSLGRGNTASNGIAEIDLSGTTYFAGGSLEVFDPLSNLDGFSRKERVRYDTPSLAGFKISVSWQDNENVDYALRFANTLGDFKLAAGIAGFHDDEAGETGVAGSVSALHVPTGLNVTFAAGERDQISINALLDELGFDIDDDTILGDYSYWFIQAGIRQKIVAAGETALSVGYFKGELNNEEFGEGELSRLHVGLVQDIDAAAMKLYAKFNHYDEADFSTGYVGAVIKF